MEVKYLTAGGGIDNRWMQAMTAAIGLGGMEYPWQQGYGGPGMWGYGGGSRGAYGTTGKNGKAKDPMMRNQQLEDEIHTLARFGAGPFAMMQSRDFDLIPKRCLCKCKRHFAINIIAVAFKKFMRFHMKDNI